MSSFVVKNNAESLVVDNPLGAGVTTLNVTAGQGVNFPSTFPFLITIWDDVTYPDPTDDVGMEICRCTGRSTDALTIVRDQEGTGDSAHTQGERVAMLITAGIFNDATYGALTKLDGITAGAIADIVEDTSPQLGGILDSNSKQIRWSKGSDVASANGLTLGDDGNYFDITGTTSITSIVTKAIGTVVVLHFDGILALTHNATDLILPGGANITTASGDEATFVEYATGDWRCTSYTKASGVSVVEGDYKPGGTDVAIVDGGTGQGTAQAAIDALSQVSGATNEHVFTKDTGTGNATWKAATGAPGSKASIWLGAEGAYLPATNPAALVEVAGATVYGGWSYLAFDDTTSEHAVWRVPMPDYDGGNIVVRGFAKVATSPATPKDLQYNILTIGLTDSEEFNAASTSDTGVNLTLLIDASGLPAKIWEQTATIDPANVAADDLMVIELARDVASDDLPGDGQLVGILLEYTKT